MTLRRWHVCICLIIIILTFSCCDCVVGLEGLVIDKETHAPLKRVHIDTDKNWHFGFTDSLGHFRIIQMTGGLIFSNPKVEVNFYKDGYYPVEATATSEGKHVVIEMQKK